MSRQQTADSGQQENRRAVCTLHVMIWRQLMVCCLLSALCCLPAFAANTTCTGGITNVEQFHYSWRLRGGLSWIAGIMFPTNGVGELKTTYPSAGKNLIDSSLLITAQG